MKSSAVLMTRGGREGDWMVTGFSPWKQNLTLPIRPGFERYTTLMEKPGKYMRESVSVHQKPEDADREVFRQLIASLWTT